MGKRKRKRKKNIICARDVWDYLCAQKSKHALLDKVAKIDGKAFITTGEEVKKEDE